MTEARRFIFILDGEEEPRPLPVGEHRGRMLVVHESASYPCTLIVHPNGSATIRVVTTTS